MFILVFVFKYWVWVCIFWNISCVGYRWMILINASVISLNFEIKTPPVWFFNPLTTTLFYRQFGLSLLQSNSTYIDRNYLSTWKPKSPFNLNKFKVSFFRPALKPDFPLEVRQRISKEEKVQVIGLSMTFQYIFYFFLF